MDFRYKMPVRKAQKKVVAVYFDPHVWRYREFTWAKSYFFRNSISV